MRFIGLASHVVRLCVCAWERVRACVHGIYSSCMTHDPWLFIAHNSLHKEDAPG